MKWYLTMILPYHSLTSYFSFWHLSPPDISLSLLESKYQEGKGFICIAYYITNQPLLFNCQVVSDFLRPHGLQHTRLPCPSPSPRVCSNSCPLNWRHPLLPPPPPAFYFSQHQDLFQWVRWPMYWSISFSISPSSEYSGLISFRIDWFDLLAVQGTLESFLQDHNSRASILQHSVFFMVQFPHLYKTTGDTIALNIWNFVDKVMSLLFNMLSRLVIVFLLKSKHLLISWLQLPSAVILELKKVKSVILFTLPPSICHDAGKD